VSWAATLAPGPRPTSEQLQPQELLVTILGTYVRPFGDRVWSGGLVVLLVGGGAVGEGAVGEGAVGEAAVGGGAVGGGEVVGGAVGGGAVGGGAVGGGAVGADAGVGAYL
jgi:hypothetical protein